MKFASLIIAMLFGANAATAQTVYKKDNIVLTVGAYGAAGLERGFSRNTLVYLPTDETFVSVGRSKENTKFTTFSQKLKVIDTKVVSNAAIPDKTNFHSTTNINGKIFYIHTLRDFSQKKMDFFFLGFDAINGKAEKAKVFNITEADFGTEYLVLRRDNEFKYELYDSARKVLFTYKYLVKKNSDKKSYFASLQAAFDVATGKQLWTAGIVEPYDKDKATLNISMIDGKGNTYALFTINNEKGGIANKEGAPDYSCELMKYTPDGKFESLLTYKPTKFTVIHKKYISADGILTMAGTYSDKDGEGKKGVYTVRIDLNSRKVVYERHFAFTDEMVNYLMADKKGQKGKEYGVDNLFGTDQVRFNDNGGFIYTAQVSYTQGGKDNFQFIYNDIVAMRVSGNGKLEWARMIPKRQMNDGGYTTVYYKGKDYFFFSDNPSNTKLSLDMIPATYVKGEEFAVRYVAIDNAGDATTGTLGPISKSVIDYMEFDRTNMAAENVIVGTGLLTGYSIKIE